MKERFYKVIDDAVAPIILPPKQALVYIEEILEGRSLNMPITVEVIELTEEEYEAIPEFEG